MSPWNEIHVTFRASAHNVRCAMTAFMADPRL